MPDFFINDITLFAEVILPLPLQKNYTYGIPPDLESDVAPGKRVEIQFGQRKIYAGLIKRLHHEAPTAYRVKPIVGVLDDESIVSPLQLKFWKWMADYYLCSEGDVMNAALPAGFKLESETSIILHPAFGDDFSQLNDREYVVAEALTVQKELRVAEIAKILRSQHVYPVLESLMRKRVAIVKENLVERFKPRIETFIRLSPEFSNEQRLTQLMDELEKKALAQLKVLISYLHLSRRQPGVYSEIAQAAVLEKSKSGAAALNALVKKQVLLKEKKEVSRLGRVADDVPEAIELSKPQEDALRKIQDDFKEKNVVLLHGITGSGKTNLYIKLMEQVLERGEQVLYLLPEIALTAQIIERLRKIFGSKIGIYHSRFNQQERVEIWEKLLHGEYRIILGARSALFLPFENLGLLIVDEEHDASYKQDDPAPRYHGRDAAIQLAVLHSCKTLLGSATPSLESMDNAQRGKFGLASLNQRYGDATLPQVVIANLRESKLRKEMHSHFTPLLLDSIKAALEKKQQVIIFQNRRGYAPFLECQVCHWVANCPNCDVHLTYHKFQNELKCHYCGHRKNNPTQCPACGSAKLQINGFGTEKVEDDLKIFFPDAVTARLDYDTARKKGGYRKIIHAFETEQIHILVGTQMVTKGLDFGNVSLVGIMNADLLMSYPDFRSTERAFQLMSQVSGRAGRKDTKGKVIIQSYDAKSPLLQYVIAHDYPAFYAVESDERRKFFYPPYSRMIQITFKHREAIHAWEAARTVTAIFKNELGKNILGPAEPAVNRIKNQYLVQVLMKLPRSARTIASVKEKIRRALNQLQESPSLRSVHVVVDVDPQ